MAECLITRIQKSKKDKLNSLTKMLTIFEQHRLNYFFKIREKITK